MHDLIIGHGTTIVDPVGGFMASFTGTQVMKVAPQMLRNGANGTGYHEELQYLALLQELVDKHDEDPTPREDRTGTGTFSVFGRQIRFNLTKGMPLLTTKRLPWKLIVSELLWMLSGSTNIQPLLAEDNHIWDEWADEKGNLGPVYGAQWRAWSTVKTGELTDLTDPQTPSGMRVAHIESIDQISQLIQNLKDKPNDRGHVVSAWNVADLPEMRLRPCHCLFQFYVDDGKLSCQLYQRSADIFLGVPFNIASYAILTHLIAREVGLEAGEFIHTFGDLHLYANHVEQAKEQLSRTPREFPSMMVTSDANIFELKTGDVITLGYDPHPAIKGDVSV